MHDRLQDNHFSLKAGNQVFFLIALIILDTGEILREKSFNKRRRIVKISQKSQESKGSLEEIAF